MKLIFCCFVTSHKSSIHVDDTKRIAHVTAGFFLFFISFDTLKSVGRKFFKGKELEK